jgi:hypothetical protein
MKLLSQGCRVDAVTPSVQVVWWLTESWCWCEALHYHYHAEATFRVGSSQIKHDVNASTFFSLCWYVCLSFVPVSITSRRNTPFTVPECHNHHRYSWWREFDFFFSHGGSACCHYMDCLFVWGSKKWTQLSSVIKRFPPQSQSTLTTWEKWL